MNRLENKNLKERNDDATEMTVIYVLKFIYRKSVRQLCHKVTTSRATFLLSESPLTPDTRLSSESTRFIG